MSVAENLEKVLADIRSAEKAARRAPGSVDLIAVSKTHPAEDIVPAIRAGQRKFGENRVQEAQSKWPPLKADHPDIELHLIGPLQSNKAAAAVALFDVIQSIDRKKIAREIAKEISAQNRQPRLYVQVNTGAEPQKAGIAPEDVPDFVDLCRGELGLTVEGLMCIPPVEDNPGPHFALLAQIAARCGLPLLSMGMSGDYPTAIEFGATEVRVGTAIFGERDYPATSG